VVPKVTVISTVFSPVSHVAAAPFVCATSFTRIAIVAPVLAATAVIVFVAFDVAAV